MPRLFAVTLLIALGACASNRPSWVDKLPKVEGWRYEWGSFKAYHRADSRQGALETAVRLLAGQKGVDVKSVSISKTTESGFSATMITEQNLEVRISGLEIVEWWEVPDDTPGRTPWEYYVLIRIRESALMK